MEKIAKQSLSINKANDFQLPMGTAPLYAGINKEGGVSFWYMLSEDDVKPVYKTIVVQTFMDEGTFNNYTDENGDAMEFIYLNCFSYKGEVCHVFFYDPEYCLKGSDLYD